MTSAAQLDANRRNAQKSTGPKSEAGKKHSSENALIHGLTAKRVLLPGEDKALFETMWYEACAYFAPEGPELAIVRVWFEQWWRLRRLTDWERVLYQQEYHEVSQWEGYMGYHGGDERRDDDRIAYVVSRMLNGGSLNKLQRYESGIHRQLLATTKLLLELRKARGASPLPIYPVGTA
jgi:hypothetical protein